MKTHLSLANPIATEYMQGMPTKAVDFSENWSNIAVVLVDVKSTSI